MRQVLFGLLLFPFVFVVTSCATPKAPISPNPAYYPDLYVDMSEGGGLCLFCFTRLEIYGDGSVSYNGLAQNGIKITPQQMGELVAAIKNTDEPWAEKDRFAPYTVRYNDALKTYLSTRLNGQSKHFSYTYIEVCIDHRSPWSRFVSGKTTALCELADTINAIASSVRSSGTAPTTP